jgi:uncharacterized protein
MDSMEWVAADGSELEVLSEEEAFALLATVSVGRLVYSDRALPSLVPVTFGLDGADIVIRTGRRSSPATRASGNVVAFEVDDIGTGRSGWTVLVTGRIELVVDAFDVARLGALQLPTWTPAASDRYLRLRPELIAGRRIPALIAPVRGSSSFSDGHPPHQLGPTLWHGMGDERPA